MDEDDDTPTRAPSAVRSFCANPTFNLEDGSPVHSLDVPGPTAIPQLTEIGSNQPQYPGMQAEARPVVYEGRHVVCVHAENYSNVRARILSRSEAAPHNTDIGQSQKDIRTHASMVLD
ncbi:hypothetical protein BD309DRAFT_270860 [Dichomitus squalens]|nr:hypothetical protein BD309DRAFT_270860 [Dichomitus squalens]